MVLPVGLPALAASAALFAITRRWLGQPRADLPETSLGMLGFVALAVAALAVFDVTWALDPLFAGWSWLRTLTAGFVAAALVVFAAAVIGRARGRRRRRS
ncbi:hypothetical protein LNKW23_20800 [Paralimibaculum aggregatum]|uniref:Uncharacterized protein n=1 Tax=Paralimibaculum aggregatum TaxID=3036245 RepID=A0ABQ6LMF5_9RHOB|nr:hypothetical protein [Limibaculum sp. NKW23]GMG82867.1 hypothetical protein LNKW23_20800 [Limibaculum sp. NKW23]